MPSIPNTLHQMLWVQWLQPAFQADLSPDASLFNPLLFNSPRLALELAQSISLDLDKSLEFMAYLTKQAKLASSQAQRPVFWLHLQAFYCAQLLTKVQAADYLNWLQQFQQPQSHLRLVQAELLLWSVPAVLEASSQGRMNIPWLPGTDLSPANLSKSYDWIQEHFFPHPYQVKDSFDTVWLTHLMAWLQPVYNSSNGALRLQATPLLVQILRRAHQAIGWLRMLEHQLADEDFWSQFGSQSWEEGYLALGNWLAELRESEDLQSFRDELFRELGDSKSNPHERILRKVTNRLSRPEINRSTHLISLHAFIRTPEAKQNQLRYLPVKSIWDPESLSDLRIKPGRQDLPFLVQTHAGWKQAWEIGRKFENQPEYKLRLNWESSLRRYADEVSGLETDAFKRMRAQQVFEIVCFPHSDFYFAWIIFVLLTLRELSSSEQQRFFDEGLTEPLVIPGYQEHAPSSWKQLLQQTGLNQSEARRKELLDGLHRLSCHPRLALSTESATGWHVLGEFATLFAQTLSTGSEFFSAFAQTAQLILNNQIPALASYWQQTKAQTRERSLPDLNAITAAEFLKLSPFPFLLAEIYQHLDQSGSGYFFFVPLSQEQFKSQNKATTLIPAAFLTGNLKQLKSQAAWPFVNTRYLELIANIGELNRLYLDTIFITQRAADQERLHQLEAERRELAADHARVVHLQGIDEDLQTLMQGIRQLRQQAVQLQNRVFPGTYGVLSLRDDLEWLFQHNRDYEFQLTLELETTPLHKVSVLDQARDLLKLHERYREESQTTAIREVSVQPEKRGKPNKGHRFKTMHSETNSNFAQAWPDYLPILFTQALYLKLPLLKEILFASKALNGLQAEDIKHEQQLFRLLKSLIHRSHSPMRYGKGAERRNLLDLAQLLGVLLDAWSWDPHYALTIDYLASGSEPVRLVDIHGLLNICQKISTEEKDAYAALNCGQAVYLAPGIRPFELLNPIHQLISHELRPGADLEACYLTDIQVVNQPDHWILRLICRQHLPEDALRTENGEQSGLSSCLLNLAKALNTALPSVTSLEPEEIQPAALWINRYTQLKRKPAGRQPAQTVAVPYTEIGIRLMTGVQT